jgi:hypothetical protein
VVESAARVIARRENARRAVLQVAGRVSFDRTDVVGNIDSGVTNDEHDAKVARLVRDLAAATQDAQHILQRAPKNDSSRDRVAGRLRGPDLVDESSPHVLCRGAIRGCDDERYPSFGEQPNERRKLGVEGVRSDK